MIERSTTTTTGAVKLRPCVLTVVRTVAAKSAVSNLASIQPRTSPVKFARSSNAASMLVLATALARPAAAEVVLRLALGVTVRAPLSGAAGAGVESVAVRLPPGYTCSVRWGGWKPGKEKRREEERRRAKF